MGIGYYGKEEDDRVPCLKCFLMIFKGYSQEICTKVAGSARAVSDALNCTQKGLAGYWLHRRMDKVGDGHKGC